MDSPTEDNGTPKMKQKSIRDFYKRVADPDVAHVGSESSQQKNLNLKRKNSFPNDSTVVEKRKIDVNYNLRKKQVDRVVVDVEGDNFTGSEGSNDGSDFVPEDCSNDSSDNGVKETTEVKKNRSFEKVQKALELPKMKSGVGNGESKDKDITPKLPNGYSDWMEKSVSRWKLQPPYSLHTEESWRKYYQEREALEWRSEHIWQENGRDCPGKCGDWYDPAKMPKWSLDWKQPRMKPCCAESYADDWTEREEYEELVQHIRGRVKTTIAKCSRISPLVAEAAALGAYVLQYWINREGSFRDDSPRTCHFENRFYVPIGTGESYDLHYIYHLRKRFYCDGEMFSSLHVGERTIQDCDPEDPTPIKEWYPAKGCRSKKANARMVKLLSQEGKKKASRTTQGVLKEMGRRILGKEGRMSERKVWELMARAGGMCAAGEEVNHFKGAQKLGKLAEGEETDEQEASSGQETSTDEETSTDDEETSDKEEASDSECVIC